MSEVLCSYPSIHNLTLEISYCHYICVFTGIKVQISYIDPSLQSPFSPSFKWEMSYHIANDTVLRRPSIPYLTDLSFIKL